MMFFLFMIVWILLDISEDVAKARIDSQYREEIREIDRKYNRQRREENRKEDIARQERHHKEMLDATKRKAPTKRTYRRSITDGLGRVLTEEVIDE